MPATIIENKPIAPVASEQAALDALRRLLTGEEWCDLKLMGPDGTPLDVPPSVVHAPRRVVSALVRGRAVMVDDLPTDVTILDAADLLGLRPVEVERLIEQGRLPSTPIRGIRGFRGMR